MSRLYRTSITSLISAHHSSMSWPPPWTPSVSGWIPWTAESGTLSSFRCWVCDETDLHQWNPLILSQDPDLFVIPYTALQCTAAAGGKTRSKVGKSGPQIRNPWQITLGYYATVTVLHRIRKVLHRFQLLRSEFPFIISPWITK